MPLSPGQRDVLVIATALKVLLYPAYRSTDFEVHRNWLAITHHLPLKQWYYDTTSEWTLDYPPFFAYFSYALSLPACFLPASISEPILRLSSTPVAEWGVVGYMRTTVLITELVLLWGLLKLANSKQGSRTVSVPIALSVFLHPGFLMLDSIHFQYNAFLFGLMVLSVWGAAENRPLVCSVFFAALLNFKHIYVYLAPAWFIYLFRAYVFPPNASPNPLALVKIGITVVLTFAASIGPSIHAGGIEQGEQLLSRLFPFTRGLMHAYWAPNVWATVALVDRVLLKASSRFPILSQLGLKVSPTGVASASRGLVGDTNFAILPDVKPIHCFALTALFQLVLLAELWWTPTYRTFLRGIAHCGFASFMFGWHVHEKAIMLVLVPLSLIATQDWNHYRTWRIATAAGTFSLFPLLFKPAETPVKILYTVAWGVFSLPAYRPRTPPPKPNLISRLEALYLHLFPLLQLFYSFAEDILGSRWKFAPLMATSMYCSVGLVWSWGRLMWASARGASEGLS